LKSYFSPVCLLPEVAYIFIFWRISNILHIYIFTTLIQSKIKSEFQPMYEGKSISKLQIDMELKQTTVLIWKILSFLNIISLYTEALVPSFHMPLKTSSIQFFGLLSEPGGDFIDKTVAAIDENSTKNSHRQQPQRRRAAIRRLNTITGNNS
jgi:hypothetical protein